MYTHNTFRLKTLCVSLAGVAQLVGVLSGNQKVVDSVSGQGTHLGCQLDSPKGGHGRMHVVLPPALASPPHLARVWGANNDASPSH